MPIPPTRQRPVRSVAVIGAGPAGLVAAKECLASGFSVVILEQRSTAGGTWQYSPEAVDARGVESSAMYRSVTANASRPFLEFSDFPIPDTVPVYPRHTHMAEYLEQYATHFEVAPRIRFGCTVVSVTPAGDTMWDVSWRHEGSESRETFDAVVVATGHHSTPRWPGNVRGIETFGGPVFHSRSYKTPSIPVETLDRRVLVVGIGNSACDIATDLALAARKVYLSTRSGGWVYPRWIDGRPVDQVDFETRFHQLIFPEWLTSLLEPLTMRRVKRRYFGLDRGVRRWGLNPRFGPWEAHAAVNEQLLPAIGNGSIVTKGDLTELSPGTAHFADGTTCEIDIVIFATGFSIAFPFLSDGLMPVDQNANLIDLYQQILHPDLPETLVFAGLVQPQIGFMPIIEMQARWITALWQGRIQLPSGTAMRDAIVADRENRARMYVDRPRHTLEVEWPGYTDLLASQLGVMPRPLRHWRILRQFLFEPVHAAQYRLDGEGAKPVIAEKTLRRLARNRKSECFNKE